MANRTLFIILLLCCLTLHLASECKREDKSEFFCEQEITRGFLPLCHVINVNINVSCIILVGNTILNAKGKTFTSAYCDGTGI